MHWTHGAEDGARANDGEPSREGRSGRNVEGASVAAERRLLELERENDRLEALLDVLGHDLRNHLAVAKGRLELARREDCDGEEDLEAVARSHERMEELLEDLLGSDVEGFVVGDTEPVSLGSCARRAWETLDSRGAEVVVGSDPEILADPARLMQLLENLFRNSLEHGSAGGGSELTVTVGATADGRGFYVEDDGCGLPSTRRGRLFEAGYSTATGGTGLGLSIVRDVVVGHGWTVDAMESDVGGARFEVRGVEQPGRKPTGRPAE